MKEGVKGIVDLFIIITKFMIGVIIYSLIYYILGYILGIVINMIIGNKIVEGLNTLLGAGRIVKENIPVICGSLSVINVLFRIFARRK